MMTEAEAKAMRLRRKRRQNSANGERISARPAVTVLTRWLNAGANRMPFREPVRTDRFRNGKANGQPRID
jgi:hypothetical protein